MMIQIVLIYNYYQDGELAQNQSHRQKKTTQ